MPLVVVGSSWLFINIIISMKSIVHFIKARPFRRVVSSSVALMCLNFCPVVVTSLKIMMQTGRDN